MDALDSGGSPPAAANTISAATLAARFERLPFTRYQRKLGFILATCFVIDLLDISLLSYLLAPISLDLQLSKGAAGLVGAAGFAGMGIGATIAGVLADRFGRRRILVHSMLLWGAATLLAAFAWDFWSFLTFRFITGIGLGAELPAALSLLAEFMPANRRASLTGWMQVGGAAAGVAFGALSLLAVSFAVAGWRGMFVLIAVSAVFALYVRRGLPESPRWYQSRGYAAQADIEMRKIEAAVETAQGRALPPATVTDVTEVKEHRGSLRELVSRRYLRRTLLAWALWLIVLIGYYGITVWVGKLLVDRGMSISKSIAATLLMQAGAIPGAWLAGYTLERVGRKAVMVAALGLVGVTAWWYGHASSFGMVVVAGATMQFSLVAVATALYAYTPELFPTRARATGMGTASTVGRVSAITGPLIVPPMVLAWGNAGTFTAFAACFGLGAIIVLVFGPETKARVLEHISS
ncbi:MFS transporter [Amycolatopsis thermoflava]|uniref:MFS transporter n=1 Tax=Amycolatopsis thermoflava TaxID=84480 RepID=UPI0014289784|nr:MFS transporter [Amycolatopsis thermoflava]